MVKRIPAEYEIYEYIPKLQSEEIGKGPLAEYRAIYENSPLLKAILEEAYDKHIWGLGSAESLDARRLGHGQLLNQMADDEALQGKADEVIKGVLTGKLPPKKVDELHEATGRAQKDRAVGRAIGSSRMQIGLVTEMRR